MDRNRQLWQLLQQRGLANESQLQWGWSQIHEGQDLCDVLINHELLSAEQAQALRQECRASPTPESAPGVLERASESFLQAAAVEPLIAPHADHVLENLGKLGEGGMGVVHRVLDQRLGRHAAMKVLRATDLDSAKSLRSRFLREAQITAALDHPAVPAVYELGVNAKAETYMLMRVIEGETLLEKIDRYHQEQDPKTRRSLLETLLKVAEAVAYAHQRHFIHRDLKPSNIMVGEFGEVMVMDWGLARNSHQAESDDSCLIDKSRDLAEGLDVTQVGAVIGTFGYMPPEQAAGDSVDERADVFALGAILTKILSGEPPVVGKTAINRMTATLKGEIVRPAERCAVPAELNALADQCLQFGIRDRLVSAEAFVINLRAFLTGDALPIYQYNVFEKILRHMRQRAGLYVSLSVLFTVSLIALFALIEGMQLKTRERILRDKAKLEVQARNLAEEKQKLVESENEKIARKNRVFELINEADSLAKRSGSPDLILVKLKEALRLSDHSATTYLAAAHVFDTRLLWRQGLKFLEQGAKRNPPGFELYFRMYLLQINGERWARERVTVFGGTVVVDNGQEILKTINELSIQSGEVNEFTWLAKGLYAAFHKNYDDAIKAFDKAETLNQNMAVLYQRRAHAHVQRGRWREALRDYQSALVIQPNSLTWFDFGHVYYQQKRYRNAAEAFRLAARDNSAYRLRALRMRAGSLAELQQFDKAIICLDRLLSIDPKHRESRQQRAGLLFHCERIFECIRDYDWLLQNNPNDVKSRYWRAACYLELGQKAKGIADFRSAYKQDPHHRAAISIMQKHSWLKGEVPK